MEHIPIHNRLAWFIPVRLATYVILFAAVVLWMGYPGFLRLPFILYSILALSLTLLLAFDRRRSMPNLASVVTILHFIFEVIVESGIVYATGNINSPFSVLFILTIASAALVYRLVGTLVMASVVSFAYAVLIWLGLSSTNSTGLSGSALRIIFDVQDEVFYSIFLHILIFYLAAFITGYLAQRLRYQDLKLADASIALRKARLETDDILRHLNSGLLTIDPYGCIVFFNRSAETILGYDEVAVSGLSCTDVFNERMPNLASCLMDAIHQRVPQMRREIEIIDGDDKKVPLGLSISLLTNEDRALRGVIAIFSDLTEAKLLEAKVRAGDRLAAVGEMSASIAHEIRNPLAAISGSVEVLKSDLELTGQNLRLMDLIVKESHRLSRILSEFLNYARIERAAYNKVDLCRVIGDTIQVLRHHSSFHDKIEVSFESGNPILYVVGDEDLFKQLLLNLAVNACDALGVDGGHLVFSLYANNDEGSATLRVEDDGEGLSADQAKHIYEPFYSTKKLGTGLGLAIVHRICSALKLGLGMDSLPGEGTTFSIVFRLFQSPIKSAVAGIPEELETTRF
ncbi:MAG: PAS domain-containing protein [candidate division Zixibacteria bacterium]|nr:PAS domain-containing protein [candidate division Zixibacteria bacterium]